MTQFKQGDILVIKATGERRKILGVCGEVCFLSLESDFEKAFCAIETQKDLLFYGFTLEEKNTMESQNKEKLESFTKYCEEHPDQRFWQALRNWSGEASIFVGTPVVDGGFSISNLRDTFYDK